MLGWWSQPIFGVPGLRLQDIAGKIKAMDSAGATAVVWAGDFNQPPTSSAIQRVPRQGLAQIDGNPKTPTLYHPLLFARLDHFIGRGVTVTRTEIPDKPTWLCFDHLPCTTGSENHRHPIACFPYTFRLASVDVDPGSTLSQRHACAGITARAPRGELRLAICSADPPPPLSLWLLFANNPCAHLCRT